MTQISSDPAVCDRLIYLIWVYINSVSCVCVFCVMYIHVTALLHHLHKNSEQSIIEWEKSLCVVITTVHIV